jgi:hypothetical protein
MTAADAAGERRSNGKREHTPIADAQTPSLAVRRRDHGDVSQQTETNAVSAGSKRPASDDGDSHDGDASDQNRSKFRRVERDADDRDFDGSEDETEAAAASSATRSDATHEVALDLADRSPRRRRNSAADDDGGSGSNSPPCQTEIKNQRPRSLLAQHRLQVSSTPSAGRLQQDTASAADRGRSPGTMDLSNGGRDRSNAAEDFGASGYRRHNVTDGADNVSGDDDRRPRGVIGRQSSADSDVFDEDAADVEDNDDEEQSGYHQRSSLRIDTHHSSGAMPPAGLNFYGGLANSGSAPMTSLPPTPTSAGLLVGLDYSMHRQPQQQIHHQMQLQQTRFDSLMDRRFMPSPPPPSSFPLPHSPSSGGASSIDRDEACSPSSACGSGGGLTGSSSPGGPQRQWTFQEQFKQVNACAMLAVCRRLIAYNCHRLYTLRCILF